MTSPRPPCPPYDTAGTPLISLIAPLPGVYNLIAPRCSVTSRRPSGRNSSAQGTSKFASSAVVKGWLCADAAVLAPAATSPRAISHPLRRIMVHTPSRELYLEAGYHRTSNELSRFL